MLNVKEFIKNKVLTELKINDIKIAHCSPTEKGYCIKFDNIFMYLNYSEDNTIDSIIIPKSLNSVKYNQDFAKHIMSKLPTKEQIEIEMLPCELKEIYQEAKNQKCLEYAKDWLFKNETIVIAQTGVGKTYSTALKALENMLDKDVLTIISTNENTNLESLEKSFREIISKMIKKTNFKPTKTMIETLKSNEFINRFNINKIIRSTTLPREDSIILKWKIIITNHKYFYNIGHLAVENKKILRISELFKNTHKELIIDEFESFEKSSILNIQLNGFYKYTQDLDTKKVLLLGNFKKDDDKTSCMFKYSKTFKKLTDEQKIKSFAHEERNLSFKEDNQGITYYRIDKDGTKNLTEIIKKYCSFEREVYSIESTLKPRKIVDKSKYCYITLDVVTQLNINIDKDDKFFENTNYKTAKKIEALEYCIDNEDFEIEPNISKPIDKSNQDEYKNFMKLLKKSDSLCTIKRVLIIGDEIEKDYKDITEADIHDWISNSISIDNLDSFKNFILDNYLNNNEKLKLKELLKMNCEDLFKESLHISIKSALNLFDCNKYYMTANNKLYFGYNVDASNAFISSDKIEKMFYVFLDSEKNTDTLIIDNLKTLKDKKNTLIFCAEKANVTENIKKIPNFIEVKTNISTTGDVKCTFNNSEKIENITKNAVLTYIHGNEKQGKNYKEMECIILNGNVKTNTFGRIYKNEDGNIDIKSKSENIKEELIQAGGRILRVKDDSNIKAKCMFIIGDPKYLGEFRKTLKNYNFESNFKYYTKNITHKKNKEKAFIEILSWLNAACRKYNDNENIDLDDFDFDTDKRSKGNNTKCDKNKVWEFYESEKFIYEYKNNKKLKDTIIIPEIMRIFGISETQFKRIKKEMNGI